MPALFYIALLFWLEHLAAATLTIEADSLRAQGLMTPTGISTTLPTLSWRLLSDGRNETQIAYQLQAASTYSDLQHYPDLWDTSKVEGTDIAVIYSGKELSSRSVVYWRVRVWDQQGRVSRWSQITKFEMGLLQSSDWSAEWIMNEGFKLGETSLPLFAKSIKVSCPVAKARLYILGLSMQSV